MVRFPVSFAQQRLWFLEQLMPGEATYLMPYAIWLDGPLDADALQQAMAALVARHAVLRTSIVAMDGLPEQVVADTAAVPIERITLPAAADGAERIRQAEAIAADRVCRPFDLARGPLVRAVLIEAGTVPSGAGSGPSGAGTGPSGARSGRHLLALALHHIICDGISMRILTAELSALYRAELTGAPPALATRWLDYGDYAIWQRDRLRGEELDRQVSYWQDQLSGAPELLTLPADRPRPARQSAGGAVASVSISAGSTRRLGEVARAANATMFMAFLTGYAAVLSRYARQDDLMIGTPVAGRTHQELEPVVGMFTNTVALRISLAGDPTFAELLSRVRDVTADAISHQELPFETLVERLAPSRSLAHAPLMQVQFAYQSLTPPVLDLDGITARGHVLHTGTAKLDLTMYADTSAGESTALVLEYSTDLFGPAWADGFLHHLACLLAHAADAAGTPVAELPLLSPAETRALTTGPDRAGAQPGSHPGPAGLLDQLLASAAQVIDDQGATPVAQLCDRAARLAGLLARAGVGVETPVGLCLGRGAPMLTALLAVWWAGGAYVPLDPAFPPARLAAMARGAGLRTVISDAAHRDLAARAVATTALATTVLASTGLPADGVTVICADDPAMAAAEPVAPVPVPPGALAYLIFTSGSTGQPKGVGIEHQAVANLIASFRRTLALRPGDRLVAVTTLSFDIALLELLLPLVSGADLVIATAAQASEADRLRALIERTSATVLQATPQTWRLLLAAGPVPDGLRLRLCGGEALPRDLADRLAAPGTTTWNLYGPTETTVWSAAGRVGTGTGPVRIGPPIEHTRMYLLDDRLNPVPAGLVGEVYLAGRGVARGYLGRPRLTAQAFRPDPWGGEPGARMYRTGDLGRWREGGGLELIGRTDHQVKVRGFRIECGEIEAVLRAHRDVRQAAVVTATRGGEPVLVGYVVPRRGSAAAQPGADLLDLLGPGLRAALPDYMIPALLVALPALPLTPNAKVDRAALPAPEWEPRAPAAGRVEPRSPVEAALARIWADLLAAPAPVGVLDNLFELGARSLTAARFVARVADIYGVSLPVHHVFSGPTVAELAAVVSADPDFGRETSSPRHAGLDALSDEDLDELLRAALAQRNRRQAIAGGPEPAAQGQ